MTHEVRKPGGPRGGDDAGAPPAGGTIAPAMARRGRDSSGRLSACAPITSPCPMEGFMRQPLLVLPGPSRPDRGARATPFVGAARMLRAGIPLMALAALMVGCASHTLMPREQAQAIQGRDRALSPHSDAIQAAIRQSGRLGALAFLDDVDGRLVVIPGDSPAEAWARHAASSPGNGPAGGVTIPAVVSFV